MAPRRSSQALPASPFFHPSSPYVVVVQHTPGGSRHSRREKKEGQNEECKAGILGTTANLINAIVGSGIVGIPYAIKEAGFAGGIFLIVFIAFLTEKSLRLLVDTAKHVHCPTYETAAEAAFGVNGYRFVAINMFITAYGAMVSYLIIVRDSFSLMLGIDINDWLLKRAVLVTVSLAVIVPLSSQRDMANLSFTSRLNVIVDTCLVVLVAHNAPVFSQLEAHGGLAGMLANDTVHWSSLFVGIGVLSFAFVCQHSAFIIAGSLENPTSRRWALTSTIALSCCVCLALLIGIAGYVGYQQDTYGNILNNLSASSWTANVARGMLGCTMLFVYPLESFVARHVAVILFFAGRSAHEGDDTSVMNRRDRRVLLTFSLYVMAIIPAIIFEDLGGVLAITGAIGGSCLSYVGPGLVYMGIHGGSFIEMMEQSWFSSLVIHRPTEEDVDGEYNMRAKDALPHARPTLAVEATPLMASREEAVKAIQDAEAQQQKKVDTVDQESAFIYYFKLTVWCMLGLPVWYRIAQWGKEGLTKHAYDMAMQSPRPFRIGEVEYKKVEVKNGRIEIDAEAAVLAPPGKQLSNDDTLPLLAQISKKNSNQRGKSGQSVNDQIGKNLLKRAQEKNCRQDREADPQGDGPSWYDFFICIGYMCFGVIAFAAGIISMIGKQTGGA